MYVVCNQAPGPSVLGAPDLILGVQTVYVSNVNILTSQPPRTSKWYDVHTQMRIKKHITEITYNIDHIA